MATAERAVNGRRRASQRTPALRRTWLFGAGADRGVHQVMANSGADVLIQDLEDFTPPSRRPYARNLAHDLYAQWSGTGALTCMRINALEGEGTADLAAAMAAGVAIVAYPKAMTADEMRALDAAIAAHEDALGVAIGETEILPVCETARGVVDVRIIATGSARIRCALLGAEDLAADLCAERGRDGIELDHSRRRFIVECRAAGVEPIDAPYTFSDVEGAVAEARYARRLGYRSKSLVLSAHARPIRDVLTPSADEIAHAEEIVFAFEAARLRGDDRALVRGLWVEVPAYLNAKRLIARGADLRQVYGAG